jgi:hypothetical protein
VLLVERLVEGELAVVGGQPLVRVADEPCRCRWCFDGINLNVPWSPSSTPRRAAIRPPAARRPSRQPCARLRILAAARCGGLWSGESERAAASQDRGQEADFRPRAGCFSSFAFFERPASNDSHHCASSRGQLKNASAKLVDESGRFWARAIAITNANRVCDIWEIHPIRGH